MKKMLSLLCASLICLPISNMYVHAEGTNTSADNPATPKYLYTLYIGSGLKIEANGSATGTSDVKGDPSLVTKISVHQYLQKQNGTTWNTIDSWNNTAYTYENYCDFPYTISSSGVYRIRTVAEVYHNNVYETASANSNSVSYP